jgi:hypothetical protein
MALLVKDIRRRWPGNCLVYTWDQALTDDEREKIKAAMTDWENGGHVRFIERDKHNRYVTFIPDQDPLDGICSSSSLGMEGGQQFIRIDHDASPRQLRHEIGHALGFYHEHKRLDRDVFIDVNTAEIKDRHRYQFEKVGDTEALQLGNYDLDSVMHYGAAKSMSRNGKTVLITTDDPAHSGRIGSRQISPGDVGAIALIESGSQHVYQLSASGQIESMVQQSAWASGWTIARPYAVGGHKFLMLLRTSDGRMNLYRINLDGTISEKIQDKNWASGWTQAVKYAVLGFNYMMLYKRKNGTLEVYKINSDGTIGEMLDQGDNGLESGFSYAAAFSVGPKNFMLFSHLGGAVFVHEIEWDGKIGGRKHQQTFGKNYTVTQPYRVLESTFLFMLNSSNGVVKIRRINADGRIGEVVQEQNWTDGWTTAIPYHVGANTYLLRLKQGDGRWDIKRIGADGRMGAYVDGRFLAPGWGTVTVYGVGWGTYVLLVKP